MLVGIVAVAANDSLCMHRTVEIVTDAAVAVKSGIELGILIATTESCCCWRTSEMSEKVGKSQPIV
jgi:hypothetical protein